MRIVFMGTPEFAVPSLRALLEAGIDVVGVVTAPDKPAGRGRKINESAIKNFAVSNNLTVLQPDKLKNPVFLDQLRSFNSDLFVVVAFRMLPDQLLEIPPMGTINLHGSLLPQYRGAAPINRAVMNGETETGVTTFFIKKEIDTGNILCYKKLSIAEDETAGELHDQMMIMGAELLVSTVKAVERGNYEQFPQEEMISMIDDLKSAPKIFKEDCLVDWSNSVANIHNQIRGLSPYPTAFTAFQDKNLKIYKAIKQITEPGIRPGGFLSDGKSYLKFACRDGFLLLIDVQMEGKKRMGIEEFLRGVHL
jgi:methionyl-tRNA formyltransferase